MGYLPSHLPESVRAPARRVRDLARGALYRGSERECPVCSASCRKFLVYGYIPRQDAKCPRCGALEWHRLVWLYFARMTDLFDGRKKKVLHVAPERCFESRLQEALGDNYLTTDLLDPNVMERMDITDIQYPDETFDVIYCSHVLEHVPDDRKAMREFRRVLKKTGWAILLVPITVDKTVEDPSITDPAERLRLFGQEDHVRRYGPDYLSRLREAGLDVKVRLPADVASPDEVLRMGLTPPSGEIYYCRRA